MSNRTFLLILVLAGLLVAAAVVMHTPSGGRLMRSMRSLHGGLNQPTVCSNWA